MTAPVPEVDPGLLEVLAARLSELDIERGNELATHLARAVQAHVEGRVEAAVVGALEGAAAAVEGVTRNHTFGDWSDAEQHCLTIAARIVREQAPDARRSPETASTPDGGREL
ncbi:hypothetical protein [Nocardioides aurantiacus]|uniref:Uncharacterized protein n=1 Tax=Nocardioides aurantiacus TaxID=86796 RepID=A0A3N2CW20_9ACTN|nr:hypothetical protein [Nocardioides aurantiacus]ROR91745.1 hypothetical protein EDD33_2620 [Nocardioides aurantiacus]